MTKLDIKQIIKMFTYGAQAISDEFEYINELNVFPVPDGDTGSNMKITSEGAVTAIKGQSFTDLQTLGKTFSRALLFNARGNSGVIFSQIIKGFVSVFKEKATELTIGELAEAFSKAKDTAYKAVISPVEGTILTVIRVTSEELDKKRNSYKSIEDLFKDVIKFAEDILAKTPDFLPELKSAGVVDSGGYGLLCFLKGMQESLTAADEKPTKLNTQKITKTKAVNPNFVDNNDGFGYCCEFILKVGAKVVLEQKDKERINLNNLKKEFLEFGESLAIVQDEDILKVHVHTINPYKVLQLGQRYGEFSKVKVENMTFQFLDRNPGISLEKTQKLTTDKLTMKTAIVVTCPTAAVCETFKNDLAVNYAINCEHNGNPSIQEFLTALSAVKSKKIILIVDDGNMVLAAKEAISLFTNSNNGAEVRLINTGDIAASYGLCLSYDENLDFNVAVKKLTKKVKNQSWGKISRSIKMIKYSHIDVKKNDYIGIIQKKIISSSKNLDLVLKQTTALIYKGYKKGKNIYIFCGKDVQPSTIETYEKLISENYNLKINWISTKETVYYFHILIN